VWHKKIVEQFQCKSRNRSRAHPLQKPKTKSQRVGHTDCSCFTRRVRFTIVARSTAS
jgi:hypothetical protein